MFGWGVLKHGIPESVRFCIGDLLMYTVLRGTNPYQSVRSITTGEQTY